MYGRNMARGSRRRSLMESAAPWAGWNTLLCSASDGSGDDDGDGGDSGSGDDNDPVKKLSAKVDEILGEKKKLAAKVREYEAAEAERKAEAAKREEEEARKKGDFEKLLKAEQDKRAEIEGNEMLWKGKFYDLQMNLSLTEALDGANVKPELRKAAMALLRNIADIDDDGKVTVDDKPLADYIKAWAKSDEGKAFVLNGSSGGGANGGGNGNDKGAVNPWAKDSFSLTEQGRIYKTNKAQAIEMAAAHGIKLS
jgi:hypothetical protein